MPDDNTVIADWLAAHGHAELAWVENRFLCEKGHEWLAQWDACNRLDDTHTSCLAPIHPVPLNFSEPAPLLAAVEAFVFVNSSDQPFSIAIHYGTRTEVPVTVAYLVGRAKRFLGVGDTRAEAERAALAAAIRAEIAKVATGKEGAE